MQKSYYAVIPADVRYHPTLKANAKLLYGEITALCNERGHCWANNNYFSELYGVDDKTISRWISSLVKAKFIRVEVLKDEGFKRKIWITPSDEKITRGGRKDHYPSDQKVTTPSDEKITHNNTSINNTDNITSNQPAELATAEKEMSPVMQIFEVFYRSVNPTINYGNRTSRSAAEFLIGKYGLEKTVSIAKYACSVQTEQYAPTITTPYQLKEKLAALIKFNATQQKKGITVA